MNGRHSPSAPAWRSKVAEMQEVGALQAGAACMASFP